MNDFTTINRPLFYRLGEARLALFALDLLAADARADGDISGLLHHIADLRLGLDELRGMPAETDAERADIVVSYLLDAYSLNAVAPLLFGPATTSQSGSSIGWQDVFGFESRVNYLIGQAVPPAPFFVADFVVSLSDNRSFGKYLNGQTVPAKDKTPMEVIVEAMTQTQLPTYVLPTLLLTTTVPLAGEVGETLAVPLTATYTKNDAGVQTVVVIRKGATVLATGVDTALSFLVPAQKRAVTPLSFLATVDYTAGLPKLLQPAIQGLDSRPAQERSLNAPQAASAGFASNGVSLGGVQKVFYGSASALPATGADVRALGGSALVSAGQVLNLETGIIDKNFVVFVPSPFFLFKVIDLTTSGADLTVNYAGTAFTSTDAGGDNVLGTRYVLAADVPYASSKTHQLTIKQ